MHPDQPVPVAGLTREQARRWAAVQPQDDDRILVGESPERAAVVAGLRALASYLAANPAVPVPPYGWEVLVHAQGTEPARLAAAAFPAGQVVVTAVPGQSPARRSPAGRRRAATRLARKERS